MGCLVTVLFLSHSCQVPVMPKCFSLCFTYDRPGSLKACVRSGTCTDSVGQVFTGDLEAVTKLQPPPLPSLTTARVCPQNRTRARGRSGVLRTLGTDQPTWLRGNPAAQGDRLAPGVLEADVLQPCTGGEKGLPLALGNITARPTLVP